MPGPLDTVKAALDAYVAKDRDAIERLIADDYHFTSPLDNAIDRRAYFHRCWPNSEQMTDLTIVSSAEEGDHAWIVYEAGSAGKRFRNAELHRVVQGRITGTQVYFGWDIPNKAQGGSPVP